jgi:hypothetical protein
MEVFNNYWFIAWYIVTCITMLYIQLKAFKTDVKYGLEISNILFLYGMFWVFCPVLNMIGLLLWIYTATETYYE